MKIPFKKAELVFQYLYGEIDGYSVSSMARESYNLDSSDFLYGETTMEGFKNILDIAEPKEGDVFVDLGSGTGRAVFKSQLLFPFSKSIGVELLPILHQKALEVKENFDKTVKLEMSDYFKNKELEFINKNILDFDLTEVDFVFMNHPLKSENPLYEKLEEKMLKELKPKSKVVAIIRGLKNPDFKYLGSKLQKFSWGDSTAHFYEI
jgi:SAM-dependent methyltransferase